MRLMLMIPVPYGYGLPPIKNNDKGILIRSNYVTINLEQRMIPKIH